MLLELERSARTRIEDQEEYRMRLREGNEWIERHFPNRDTYDQVINKNFEKIRNQIFKTFYYLEDTIQLLLEVEEKTQGSMIPDLHVLLSWTAKLMEGKEE